MLEMLADSGWIVWLILAAVLIVIEILSLDLTFLMLGCLLYTSDAADE